MRGMRGLTSLCPSLLRPSDQVVVAVGSFLSVAAMAVVWLSCGGASGELAEPGDQPRRSAAFLLDINAAGAAELDLLPNIGESRAQQIIGERQRRPFASPEDVALRIKGIGDKTVAEMKPSLLPIEPVAASLLTAARQAVAHAPSDVPLASATTSRPRAGRRPGPTSE
jgi:hypothetical protein